MKPTLRYAVALGVLLVNGLVADDRRSDLAAERLRDKQERQQRLEAERNEMREHARQLREGRRVQAEKRTDKQPAAVAEKTVTENSDAAKPDADMPVDAKPAAQPVKLDEQPGRSSSGYAIAESASNIPGPVFPPVPIQSLFNTPLWYGPASRFGPYPNAGFGGALGQTGSSSSAMPPPAPPFFGYLVMPPGSPVTVPYLAPAAPADSGAESEPAPAATP